MTWRTGIPLIIAAMVIGALIGVGTEKAFGQPAPGYYPVCDNCSMSKVTTKRMGVRKFKNGKLGRADVKVHYPKGFKRVVKREGQRKLNKLAHRARFGGDVPTWVENSPNGDHFWTKPEVWTKFSRGDNCVAWMENKTVPHATCENYAPIRNDGNGWSGEDVKTAVCGFSLVVASTAITEGGGGPWSWVAAGAGFSTCMWTTALVNAAGD
jgi:hypothetical protein